MDYVSFRKDFKQLISGTAHGRFMQQYARCNAKYFAY